MIIKSTSIKDSKGISRTVHYLFKEDKQAELIYSRYLPKKAETQEMIRLLEENEKLRLRKRKDSVIITHDFISWHTEDRENIDEQQLKIIARTYADMRKDAMNITVLHKEAGHIHLHIISSGVGYGTGKATRISKAQFSRQKKRLQEFEDREMNLEHSHIDHSKKK